MKSATLIIQQKNKLKLRMKHQEKSTFLGKKLIIMIKKILEYSKLYQRQDAYNYSLLAVKKKYNISSYNFRYFFCYQHMNEILTKSKASQLTIKRRMDTTS
jgi:hypothetical protein